MRAWIWTLVVLIAAVTLALVLREHSGNVIVLAPPYRVSFSLTFAVIAAVVIFIALYVLLRFISWISAGPERFRSWRGRRAQNRDRALLESGWLNILEGRYDQAEKDLSKLLAKTRSHSSRVLAGLASARAAHNQGEYQRRDELFTQVQDEAAKDERLKVAAATAMAEMLLDQGKPQEAVSLLQPLQDVNARFLHTTRLLLRAYRQLGQHEQVYELTRLLVRRSAIDREEALAAIEEAAAARIKAGGMDQFKSLWGDLRADEKTLPTVALAAAQVKADAEEYDEAARILEAALNVRFEPVLIMAYANCAPEFYARRLSKAEEWLRKYPNDADLLAALGQLCLTGQLWGQGEHYLKRSMKLRNDMRIHALLGNLYDGLGRSADAMRHWQLASAVVVGSLPSVRTSRALPAAETEADPAIVDTAFAADTVIVDPVDEQPIAASAAADFYHDEPISPTAGVGTVPASTTSSTTNTASDEDEYFDSALPAGVDTSIISDRPDRRVD